MNALYAWVALGFNTCVRRKPTNTGLLLYFNPLYPQSWKTGLIHAYYTLLKPFVLHTSSTWKKLNACAIFFKKMVIRIGFSIKLYVGFRNDAIIPLAMKNMKRFSFYNWYTLLW